MFKLDSPFMNFLTKVADVMIVNALFLLFCIPVITAGASVTASYYIGLKMVKDEETYIVKGFWKSFKENFVQSTILWIIVLLIAGVLAMDYWLIIESGVEFSSWIRIAILTATAIIAMGVAYIFPMQARYENTIKNTIKNSFLMALSHLPTSVLLVAVWFVPGLILYFFPQSVLILFIISFGLIFFVQSFFLMKIFGKYEESIASQNEDDSEQGSGIFAESDRMEAEAALEKKKGKKAR